MSSVPRLSAGLRAIVVGGDEVRGEDILQGEQLRGDDTVELSPGAHHCTREHHKLIIKILLTDNALSSSDQDDRPFL